MAERCLCCGKKLGIFSGTHLDNMVCDGCYFRFAGYLASMDESKTKEEVEINYNEVIKVVKECGFATVGYNHVKLHVDTKKLEKEKNFLKAEQINQIKLEQECQKEVNKERYVQLQKSFLLTTGFNFEGYNIVKYLDLVSGEAVLGTGFISEFSASVSDLFGTASNTFADKMSEAKSIAKKYLIKNAINMGANALIGVDFDYITFGNNMIGVSANATAVVVEKAEN